MTCSAIKKLHYLLDIAPNLLAAIGEETFAAKPLPNKWSKKEILGHLIDSATNNHHRLVRAQFESSPKVCYDQNLWNQYGFYQTMDTKQLIHFWIAYNVQLLAILERIPPKSLSRTVKAESGELLSLERLVVEYVTHLEHHLKQIIDY